jgi:beta-lactamase regulating signal transducer with metallopeptidase domain
MLPSFLAAVADNAVGATVLAVLVFVITRFWRNPAAQHVLWLLVLVKLITPCVVPLPFGGFKVASASRTEIPTRTVAGSISSGIERPVAANLATNSTDRGQHTAVAIPSGVTAVPVLTERLGFIVLLVWLASSGGWLAVAGLRIVRFHRGLKSTARAPAALQDLARGVANRLDYIGPLEVRIAESQLPPLLWCMGRPKIVLARGLSSTLGTDELRGILAHEISHLLRRDHWARWLELVVCGLYWWHPAAWWARRELREAEERACDGRVLAAWPGTESQYAGALLAVVDRELSPESHVPLLANSFGNNGSFKRRIEAMFERDVPYRMRRLAAASILLIAAVLLPLSLRSRGAEESGKATRLAEIREGFAKLERRIVNLSVSSEAEVDNYFRSPSGGPVQKGLIQDDAYDLRQKCVSTWIVDASGRIWQKHSAQVTAIRADKSEAKHQLEIEAAFDGKRGRWIQTEHRAEGDQMHIREIDRPECYGTLSPLDVSLALRRHADRSNSRARGRPSGRFGNLGGATRFRGRSRPADAAAGQSGISTAFVDRPVAGFCRRPQTERRPLFQGGAMAPALRLRLVRFSRNRTGRMAAVARGRQEFWGRSADRAGKVRSRVSRRDSVP